MRTRFLRLGVGALCVLIGAGCAGTALLMYLGFYDEGSGSLILNTLALGIGLLVTGLIACYPEPKTKTVSHLKGNGKHAKS